MNKFKALQTRLNELEQDIDSALRECIENSDTVSEHVNTKAIKVNVFDYFELVVINDDLVFLDEDGSHYSLYADCGLDDLVNILMNQ